MRLIVTRPEPDATRTAKALIRLGHHAILSPMLDIRPVHPRALPAGDFQAVLVTSANAVRMLAGHTDRQRLAGVTLLAVGDRTALEAKRAGFSARSAGGAVNDLVALAQESCDPARGPLLHVAGEATAGDLVEKLAARGFEVATAVVYRAEPRARLSGVAAAALREGNVDGVLIYSARSAAAFAAALAADSLSPLLAGVALFCISAACAEPLRDHGWGVIAIATQPDQLSLFAEIERAAAMR
jgi:uroporphyrinogen-III synthase